MKHYLMEREMSEMHWNSKEPPEHHIGTFLSRLAKFHGKQTVK
jgi:hypothetical protein